jgi:hypothetical protein
LDGVTYRGVRTGPYTGSSPWWDLGPADRPLSDAPTPVRDAGPSFAFAAPSSSSPALPPVNTSAVSHLAPSYAAAALPMAFSFSAPAPLLRPAAVTQPSIDPVIPPATCPPRRPPAINPRRAAKLHVGHGRRAHAPRTATPPTALPASANPASSTVSTCTPVALAFRILLLAQDSNAIFSFRSLL